MRPAAVYHGGRTQGDLQAMVKSRRLLGLQVIDIETGRALGRVTRLVLDPRARRAAAMVVGGGPWGREEHVLPWPQARGVGRAAVTVSGARTLEKASAQPELQQMMRRQVRIYGARVLTEDGSLLGTVEELVLEPTTGDVVELLLAPSGLAARFRPPMALPAGCVVVIGEDAVVVREGSRPYPHRTAPAPRNGRVQAAQDTPSQDAALPAPPGAGAAQAAAALTSRWGPLSRAARPLARVAARGLTRIKATVRRDGPRR